MADSVFGLFASTVASCLALNVTASLEISKSNTAFGSMFKIIECEEPDEMLDKLYFDLKLSYAKGGETEYLKKGDLIRGSNNEILFNRTKSELDYFTIQFGINFQFDTK